MAVLNDPSIPVSSIVLGFKGWRLYVIGVISHLLKMAVAKSACLHEWAARWTKGNFSSGIHFQGGFSLFFDTDLIIGLVFYLSLLGEKVWRLGANQLGVLLWWKELQRGILSAMFWKNGCAVFSLFTDWGLHQKFPGMCPLRVESSVLESSVLATESNANLWEVKGHRLGSNAINWVNGHQPSS